ADSDGRTADDLDRALTDVFGLFDVAAAADHVLVARDLDHAPPDLLVGGAYGFRYVVKGDAVPEELIRVDVDLVLLDEAADAGHFGHARNTGERVPQVPILERAQLLKVMLSALVHQRILEDPADAGRIGAERWVHALG